MQNLGKLLFLVYLFSNSMFGEIKTELSQSTVIKGNEAKLTITVYGDNIQSPSISKIGGFAISSISTESFFNSFNGNIVQGKKFNYKFYPDKNSTIESIVFNIDGQTEVTKLLNIYVTEPTFNKDNPFNIKISTSKTEYFIGETIKLNVKYIEDLNQDVVDRRYTEPIGNGLWLKDKSEIENEKNGTKFLINIDYFFTAQKTGIIEINSAKMKIGTRVKRRDSWGFFFESAKWNNIISNNLKINIKQSPAKLLGDFEISAEIDKTTVSSGESVNLILKISGDGNIEDIKPFQLDLKNGLVYDEKPNILNSINSTKYFGEFSQKFAIILNKSLTIPSFEITYFDQIKNKIITKRTESIEINVNDVSNSPLKTEKLNVIRADEVKREIVEYGNIYLLSAISFLVGITLTLIFIFSPFKKLKVWNRVRDIIKSDKQTLKLLLPYIHKDEDIYEIAKKLEDRVYKKGTPIIRRKDLKRVVLKIDKYKD